MTTQFLSRPQGRIAYETFGEAGPWVVCVPGMGDLRDEYRLAIPPLVAAGYRVAAMDVRGHGDSDTSFHDYCASAIGQDILALIEQLPGQRASVAGTSMAAAAAVWAASEQPERISGLMLLGPFVRDPKQSPLQRALLAFVMRVLFARPWGAWAWSLYYRSLYRSGVPSDFAAYSRRLRENLSQRGRLESLAAMLRASKQDCEARLAAVRAPVLVVMGDADPDFPDPSAEAESIARILNAETLLVKGAGHYPHAEAPQQVMPRLVDFLAAHGA